MLMFGKGCMERRETGHMLGRRGSLVLQQHSVLQTAHISLVQAPGLTCGMPMCLYPLASAA